MDQILTPRRLLTVEISLQIGGESKLIQTRVIEERESVDGELAEVSRNFFAQCVETRDVFYFGEEVDFYEDGPIVDHGGAWLAGVSDAQPGIIMPGHFAVGAQYYQEMAPGVAEDFAVNSAVGVTMTVPGARHSRGGAPDVAADRRGVPAGDVSGLDQLVSRSADAVAERWPKPGHVATGHNPEVLPACGAMTVGNHSLPVPIVVVSGGRLIVARIRICNAIPIDPDRAHMPIDKAQDVFCIVMLLSYVRMP
jgi:hypothetical protein